MRLINTTLIICACLASHLHAHIRFENAGQELDKGNGRQVKLGDFNCDGNLDAFVRYSDSKAVYYGDGHGLFQKGEQTFPDPMVIGDMNLDGYDDVITSEKVWLNNGQGQFLTEHTIVKTAASENLWSGSIADLNGDGHPDLFAIMDYAASRVYLNNGNGTLTDTGQKLGDGIIGSGQLAIITLGDLNNDGAIDAITGGWRWDGSTQCPNHAWLNDGNGHFTQSQGLDEGGGHVHGLALGDLNGDGWLDLVMALQQGYRSGRIYMNDGTGRLIAGSNIGGNRGEGAGLADFDADGDLDLVMAQSRPTTRVWINNGEGQLSGGPSLGSLCTWGLAVGDLNADDKPDIISVGHDLNGNSAIDAFPQIWLNTTAVLDPNGPVENKTSALRFDSVQGAIYYANSGDEIVIAPGVYRESLTLDKDIRLQSTDPNAPYAIGGTIIQANTYKPVLTLNDNTEACTIAGLTLRAGSVGVIGTTTNATFRNCRIMDNVSHGLDLTGSSPHLSHCLISANGETGITMHPGAGRRKPPCMPQLINCYIVDNNDLSVVSGQPIIVDSLITDH
ncbi:FG-GAP-like repeat-containing protein [Planctomycetota bacterium]